MTRTQALRMAKANKARKQAYVRSAKIKPRHVRCTTTHVSLVDETGRPFAVVSAKAAIGIYKFLDFILVKS